MERENDPPDNLVKEEDDYMEVDTKPFATTYLFPEEVQEEDPLALDPLHVNPEDRDEKKPLMHVLEVVQVKQEPSSAVKEEATAGPTTEAAAATTKTAAAGAGEEAATIRTAIAGAEEEAVANTNTTEATGPESVARGGELPREPSSSKPRGKRVGPSRKGSSAEKGRESAAASGAGSGGPWREEHRPALAPRVRPHEKGRTSSCDLWPRTSALPSHLEMRHGHLDTRAHSGEKPFNVRSVLIRHPIPSRG